MAESVLARIAADIPQKENLATKALCFVLGRSSAARAALSSEISRISGKAINIIGVETQIALGEESRPDILLYGVNRTLLAVIEVKFWAPLTAAQPVEYLHQLRSAGAGALLFLAPERRIPALRYEVLERCRAADEAVESLSDDALRVQDCTIAFVSWMRVLANLRNAVTTDPAATSDIMQITGLCADFETAGFLPLSHADLTDLDVPRRVLMLANLVNDIIDRAVATKLVSVQGLRAAHYLGATGRYASFERAGFWLGLSHWKWLEHGVSPIWISFPRGDWGRADDVRKALQPLADAVPPRLYVDDFGVARVPLLLPVGADKPQVVDAVVKQLLEVDRLLQMGGLPPLTNPAALTPED